MPLNGPDLLYYYTDAATALKILQEGNLWLNHIGGMNDFRDGSWLLEMIQTQLDPKYTAFVDVLKQRVTHYDTLICCLTAAKDLLSQWAMYGDGGKGIALAFSRSELIRACNLKVRDPLVKDEAERTTTISNVEYLKVGADISEQSMIVKEMYEMIQPGEYKTLINEPYTLLESKRKFFENEIRLLAHCVKTKNDKFHAEKEYRISRCYSVPKGGNPYVRFKFRIGRYGMTAYQELSFRSKCVDCPIREVWLGPCCPTQEFMVHRLLRSLNLRAEVNRSTVPLR